MHLLYMKANMQKFSISHYDVHYSQDRWCICVFLRNSILQWNNSSIKIYADTFDSIYLFSIMLIKYFIFCSGICLFLLQRWKRRKHYCICYHLIPLSCAPTPSPSLSLANILSFYHPGPFSHFWCHHLTSIFLLHYHPLSLQRSL